jgi:uncharacterized membrane protein
MVRQRHLTKFPFWTIPMMYAVVTVALGMVFPRLEYCYLGSYHHGMTVSAATAAFSAVASGMLALTATFLFALVVLGWVDRNGSGHVPFFSTWAVIVLLIASVLVLARLVQRLTIPQVTEVLYYISQRGRQVIHEVYPPPSRRWTTLKICCDGSASDILQWVRSQTKVGLYG